MPVKKKNSVRVDFTDVESKVTLPEGEYIVEVLTVVLEEGDKGEYLKWELSVVEGKFEGKKVYNNTSLTKQSLWTVKRFLEALNVDVPAGQMDVDFDELVGLKCGIVITHETYNGRPQARVVDVFPFEDEATAAEAESDEETRPTDEQIDEMGKADLRELVEKFKLDIELEGTTAAQRRAVKKAMASAAKPEAKKEEKTPAKKPAKKVTYKADDIASMSTEELTEVSEKHDLGIDFDEITVLRKQRAAVSDGLEEAGLLVEE